jgi:lactam utilization protein B
VADAVVEAVCAIDPLLILLVLPKSALIARGKRTRPAHRQ